MEPINNFYLESPYFLWLLIIIPLLLVWYYFKEKKTNSYLIFPFNISLISKRKENLKGRLYFILYVLRVLAVGLIIFAISRPRSINVSSIEKSNYGIDIVMAIDVSGSMLAKDLKPNRLTALKKVAINFVDNRKTDRIGIVSYAGESFTLCPITSDFNIVKNSIRDIKYGFLEDGTAIGMGLGTAVSRIKDSKAKSKVIILLTDGVNNAGSISPVTASEIAKEFEVKVYTIAIGTNGFAEMPYAIDHNGRMLFRNSKVEIDEDLMKEIAQKTGGKYFRATNNQSLKNIYNEIDKLEKTKVDDLKFYSFTEKFRLYTLFALGIFILEILLRFTFFRKFL